jgi:endonuclease/exonuclease/phosphatase family metal-dependent hydrolase
MNKKILVIALFSIVFIHSTIAQTFTVGTYNLRYDNPRDSGNLWKDRLPRVTALIEFHDFDLLGTQEGLQHQIDAIAKALPNYAYYGIGRDDGVHAGEHSAIFYKKELFSVIDKGDFWLSETPQKPGFGWDAKINRICSWILLKHKISGKKFYCFNVHYDHQGIQARIESSKLILSKIRTIAAGTPVILTGDLNGDHQSDCYKNLANSNYLFDTFFKTTHPYIPNGSFQGFGANLNKDLIIDHIFTSQHFKVKKWGVLTDSYDGKFPSDHFPVLSELILND